MAKVERIIDHAEKQCKAEGVRLTTKRKQILAGLLQCGKAMSAYELADYCKANSGEAIPPMSVYRILDFLQEEGLVHRLNSAQKYIACSHITCDHAHGVPQFLICVNCERVEEISISKATVTSLKRSVENAGFSLVSPQLEIDCICNSCKESAA
jgi:Fur family zinc uptake transcriptional regulator